MRIDEIVKLDDVLKGSQYIKLLRQLKTRAGSGIDVGKIKNQIVQSWKKGLKQRKHYDDLLSTIDIKLTDLLD